MQKPRQFSGKTVLFIAIPSKIPVKGVIKGVSIAVLLVLIALTMIFWLSSSPVSSLIRTNQLAGKRIVIDPGHGGIDGGANSQDFLEKEINLAVALKLDQQLTKLGAIVTLTRQKDVDLGRQGNSRPASHKADLAARVTIIETNQPDIFLSVHVNANGNKPSTTGAMLMYNQDIANAGELAGAVQNSLNKLMVKYNLSKHSAQPANYYILRHTTQVGALIELGFMTNFREKQLLKQEQYQLELSKSIVSGLQDFFFTRNVSPSFSWSLPED
ncbi:MAG: N-acetylmuramoyl-L-alanine amidase family protein [Carboxydocellales bacterium]